MNEKNYRLRVVRGDKEFEAEGDKKFVLDMLDRFEAGRTDQASPGSSTRRAQRTDVASKALSAREFIQKLALKRHTDIGLAFGYYIEKTLGKDEFTPADINNCYYEAKMEPSNTSQVIIHNTKSGRMMLAKKDKGAKPSRKTYVLTTTGEDFISNKLKTEPE